MFSIANCSDILCVKAGILFSALMTDYKGEADLTVRCNCKYQTLYPSRSKPIVDEIDAVLAEHYGFTAEELDFIVNYDIEYRLGAGAANGEE